MPHNLRKSNSWSFCPPHQHTKVAVFSWHRVCTLGFVHFVVNILIGASKAFVTPTCNIIPLFNVYNGTRTGFSIRGNLFFCHLLAYTRSISKTWSYCNWVMPTFQSIETGGHYSFNFLTFLWWFGRRGFEIQVLDWVFMVRLLCWSSFGSVGWGLLGLFGFRLFI